MIYIDTKKLCRLNTEGEFNYGTSFNSNSNTFCSYVCNNVLILPEKKRSKKYNNMLAELKVNDEVLTRGGIVGKIITIDEDQLVIQSGPDRVRIRVTKNSVAQKITKDA